MDKELSDLLQQIDGASDRLMRTASGLSDGDIRQDSLLPGWSRGHVLTHIARNADALQNLLTSARTGVPLPAYASQDAREAGIEAGAGRSGDELRADLAGASAAFRDVAQELSDDAWQAPVRILDSAADFPASQVLTRRLVEVELHHTDLGAGYGPADWPASFAAMELPEPMRSQRLDRA